MAKTNTTYRTLNFFDGYLNRLLKDKANFEVTETTLTKKIKFDNQIIIFNEDGAASPDVLQLINKVRNDAASFTFEDLERKKAANNIWFDLSERPPQTVIAKVDVKAAYWETALKLGVISEATNSFLIDKFTGKSLKKARLKALGSLATRKSIVVYEAGKRVRARQEIQATKELYMNICSMLDDVMQDAIYNLNGAFYYYWDCVFVSEQYHKDVMNFLHTYEYNSTVERTNLEVIYLGNQAHIVTGSEAKIFVSPADLKKYPIPSDKIWMLGNGYE